MIKNFIHEQADFSTFLFLISRFLFIIFNRKLAAKILQLTTNHFINAI